MNNPQALTVKDILQKKRSRKKITMLTAYDYPMASFIVKAGIDIILVGDSLANVVLGLDSTKDVGMAEMIHHAKAVRRAVKRALLVGDMPYGSYAEEKKAVFNARRFVSEAGCNAVKLEWFDDCPRVSRAIINAGIPVMGHVGLTPQTADQLGGLKVQGKDASAAKRIILNAESLDKIGYFSLVLECIPDKIAQMITKAVSIPTIGIGAGKYCDGQVLVTYDLLGLFDRFKPKFVKQYHHLSAEILKAVGRYRDDVLKGQFPGDKHSFKIDSEELKEVRRKV